MLTTAKERDIPIPKDLADLPNGILLGPPNLQIKTKAHRLCASYKLGYTHVPLYGPKALDLHTRSAAMQGKTTHP
jgi:hypothetical protein